MYLHIIYFSAFENQLQSNMSTRDLEFARVNQLVPWFERLVATTDLKDSQLAALFRGDRLVKMYKGYVVNGLKFHTEFHGQNKKTMNSGLCITSANSSGDSSKYYGMLLEVLEFTFYNPGFPEQVIHLFKCDWFDNRKVKCLHGLVELDPLARQATAESFIFPSQATQVYYARYPSRRIGRHRRGTI